LLFVFKKLPESIPVFSRRGGIPSAFQRRLKRSFNSPLSCRYHIDLWYDFAFMPGRKARLSVVAFQVSNAAGQNAFSKNKERRILWVK
jgi:hypothetical protein